MEMPEVDNEFIGLFIPDSSSFTSEEILEEFKIYIFKIMNISMDMIFQEQINNEYENNILRKNLKAYMYEKFDSVAEINSIYNQSIKKINNIKGLLDNNKVVVEKNLDKEAIDTIFQELNKIYAEIIINKALTTKNQVILDFINVPFILINLLKINNLELFIEYIRYIEGIPAEITKKHKVVEIVKTTVGFIKSVAQKYFLNNLRLRKYQYDSILINEIINIPFYECVMPLVNENTRNKMIELNVLIHTYELFKQDNQTFGKSDDLKEKVNAFCRKIEEYFSEIIKKIGEIKEISKEERENLLVKIIDNHVVKCL